MYIFAKGFDGKLKFAISVPGVVRFMTMLGIQNKNMSMLSYIIHMQNKLCVRPYDNIMNI